jgi:hypothetical protein
MMGHGHATNMRARINMMQYGSSLSKLLTVIGVQREGDPLQMAGAVLGAIGSLEGQRKAAAFEREFAEFASGGGVGIRAIGSTARVTKDGQAFRMCAGCGCIESEQHKTSGKRFQLCGGCRVVFYCSGKRFWREQLEWSVVNSGTKIHSKFICLLLVDITYVFTADCQRKDWKVKHRLECKASKDFALSSQASTQASSATKAATSASSSSSSSSSAPSSPSSTSTTVSSASSSSSSASSSSASPLRLSFSDPCPTDPSIRSSILEAVERVGPSIDEALRDMRNQGLFPTQAAPPDVKDKKKKKKKKVKKPVKTEQKEEKKESKKE